MEVLIYMSIINFLYMKVIIHRRYFDFGRYDDRMRKREGLYFSVYSCIAYIVAFVVFGDYEAAKKAAKTAPINVCSSSPPPTKQASKKERMKRKD